MVGFGFRGFIHMSMKPARDQDGAVLVLVAVTLFVLFGFAALAVDIAYAFNERRDSQAGIDVAAIGGGLAIADMSGAELALATVMVDEVKAIAERNLGSGLDWAGCSDPDRPSRFSSSADALFASGDPQYTRCISWTPGFGEIRAVAPTRQIPTFFGKVLGFQTIGVSAFAEVEAVTGGGGGVLPFGVLNGQANGILCLKTAGSFPSECSSNAQGNFGFLEFTYHGKNPAIPVPSSGTCSSNSGNDATLANIVSTGLDHDLAAAPPTAPTDDKGIKNDITLVKEDLPCPGSALVQAVLTSTGDQGMVDLGMVTGTASNVGRLTRSSTTDQITVQSSTYQIDDVPLWDFISSGCPAGTDTTAEMEACLGTAKFDDAIGTSPRLALVPELWQTAWPNGRKYVTIKRFQFVYLHTTYACQGKKCGTVWEPGTTNKSGTSRPKIVTAFAIPDAALSQEVRDNFGNPFTETYALSR